MDTPSVITEFRDEYFWLSNFYRLPFEWRGIEWPTVEHAFQAAKALGDKTYVDKVLAEYKPSRAKYHGRSVAIDVKQWDQQKDSYMRQIIHAKFAEGTLVGKLLNTGAAMLVEGNDWNDTYWGRCNGKGYNKLGAILMEERGYWLWTNWSTQASKEAVN